MEKYSIAGEATDDKKANAHIMLDSKATNTFEIRNTYCFILQQWLHESASMLRYTYIVCLVNISHKNQSLTSPLHLPYDTYPDQILRTICNSIRI